LDVLGIRAVRMAAILLHKALDINYIHDNIHQRTSGYSEANGKKLDALVVLASPNGVS
jgi:hypothetical protein